MNSREKERWLKLVKCQFADQLSKLREIDRSEELEKWVAAKISELKLTPKINKIKATKAIIQKLEQELSANVMNQLGIADDDDDRCGCHKSVERLLNQYGANHLAKVRSDRYEHLGKTERQLLAQIELAQTTADMAKIAKQAGLI